MTRLIRYAGLMPAALILAISLFPTLLVMPVMAADAAIDAYLGDTVTVSGTSFSGDRMYLFVTGPGLDANGVTLTDTTRRADQGEFTIVDVSSDETWSFRWDTSQISQSVDPGTYTVYASTGPVDKAHLLGTDTYKTLEVWLKDPETSKGPASYGGGTFTLNPEKHSSAEKAVTLSFTSPPPASTPLPSTVAATAARTPSLTAAMLPATAAPAPSIPLLAALSGMAIVPAVMKDREKRKN